MYQKLNKTKIINLLLAALIMLCNACNKDSCFSGAGKNTKKHISLTAFSTLEIKGISSVIIIEDTINYALLEGGEQILSHTHISQTDSSISLTNTTGCYMFKEYEKPTIFLHTTHLQSITINEACELTNTTAITKPLRIYMNTQIADINMQLQNQKFSFSTYNKAGGKFIFSGSCTYANLQASYTAQIDASNLQTSILTVRNHSIKDFYVWATDTVYEETKKEGSIICTGNPVHKEM
jgi:hypothetical protein